MKNKLKMAAIPLLLFVLMGISSVSAANTGVIRTVDVTQDTATTVDVEVEFKVNFTGTVYVEVKIYDGSSKIGDEENSYVITTADTYVTKTISVTFKDAGLSDGDKLKAKAYLKELSGTTKIDLFNMTESWLYDKPASAVNTWITYGFFIIVGGGGALLIVLFMTMYRSNKGIPK